jgi:hypothetical protein
VIRFTALLCIILLSACGTTNDSREAAPQTGPRHYTVFATLSKGAPLYNGQLEVIPWVPVHAKLDPVQAQPAAGAELSLICQVLENGRKLLCDVLLETREPRLEQTKARVALEVGKQATSSIRGFQLAMKAMPD